MRKKYLAIIAGTLAWLMLFSTALAVTVGIHVSNKEVFANGNDIKIKADGGRTVITDSSDNEVTYDRYDSGSDPDGDHNVGGYTVYGGWRDDDHNDSSGTSVTMDGGTVANIYGGSKEDDLNGDTEVTVNGGTVTGDVYGSNRDGEQNGDTDVNINGGTVNGSVYGGSNDADLNGDTDVDISGGTVNGSVYGGSNDDDVDGDTDVTISGGSVKGNVFGGGKGDDDDDADIRGNTNVTVSGGSVTGNVYGGSDYGDIEDREGSGYQEGKTNVTISGGTVGGAIYAGSKSDGDVEDDATIEIKGGVIVSKKIYGHGGDTDADETEIEGTVRINLYKLSATEYVFYLEPGANGTTVIGLLGEFADFGGYEVKANPGMNTGELKAWVLSPKPARTLTVVTKFVQSGVSTPVNTLNKTVSIPAGAPTTVSPSTWNGGAWYNVGTYPAPLQVPYNFNYPGNTVYFSVPVVPKTDTVTVTFRFLNGTTLVEQKQATSEVLSIDKQTSSVSATRAEDTYYNSKTGTANVAFGEADKTVDVQLVPKTDTVKVTFRFLNGTTLVEQKQVTSETLSVNKLNSTVSATRSEDMYYYSKTGNANVTFGEADKTVDVQLVPKTDTVKVTFRFLNGTTLVEQKQVTSETLSVNKLNSTVSATRAEDTYYLEKTGTANVAFGEADKTVEVQLVPKIDTVTVTFRFLNGTTLVDEEQVTSETLSVNKLTSSVSATYAEDTYYLAKTETANVTFGEGDKTVDVQLVPKTDTVTVTFRFLNGTTLVDEEQVTSETLSVNKLSSSVSATYAEDMYYFAKTETASVTFGEGDKTVDVQLVPKTDTVTVTFRFLNGTTLVDEEQVTSETLSVNKLSSSVSATYAEDTYYFAKTETANVAFGEGDKTVDVQLVPKTDTVTVTFRFLFGTTLVEEKQVTSEELSVNMLSSSVSATRAEDGHFNEKAAFADVAFNEADKTVEVQLVPKTKTIPVIFNYMYRGNIVHTEEIPVSVTYGTPASVTPTWDGGSIYNVPDPVAVPVDFDLQSQSLNVDIVVTRNTGDDEGDEIPLSPGVTPDPQIPLGLPRTGDTITGLLGAIMLAGVSIATTASRKKK